MPKPKQTKKPQQNQKLQNTKKLHTKKKKMEKKNIPKHTENPNQKSKNPTLMINIHLPWKELLKYVFVLCGLLIPGKKSKLGLKLKGCSQETVTSSFSSLKD